MRSATVFRSCNENMYVLSSRHVTRRYVVQLQATEHQHSCCNAFSTCLQAQLCDPKKLTCPHRIFLLSGLPTQNRIQQVVPKIHDPGGQPTGFEDPCRILTTRTEQEEEEEGYKLWPNNKSDYKLCDDATSGI